MNVSARTGAWLSLVEHIAGRLTRPPTDAVAIDRNVERMLGGSRLLRALVSAGALFGCAWDDSGARRVADRVLYRWMAIGKTQQLRGAAWSAAMAGATALIAQELKPMPDGPLSWIVPLGFIVAGGLLTAAMTPIARWRGDQGS